MASYHLFLLFALLFLTQFSESRLTQEFLEKAFNTPLSSKTNDEEGTMWAVLVAGSNGYVNYRHQADVCHAYQILKRGGLNDENIIVFMYDDIAYNVENPKQGTIINSPNGQDVYHGVPKDYTGESVTASNVIAAILGNDTAGGKVVKSGPNDRIFIYYSDHGGPGTLSMPDGDDIYAQDFIDTLKKKNQMGTYKSMVIYVEACEAGSIFDGLLSDELNIYVITASNPTENSYATYCINELNTCLGDLFSVSWMEDSDKHGTLSETLEQQYKAVKERTAEGGDEGSHVMQYGDTDFTTYPLSVYLGSSSPNSNYLNYGSINEDPHKSNSFIPIEQHEADIFYLKQKVLKAPEGTIKKKEAQKELEDALSHRKNIDHTFEEIGKTLFGHSKGYDILKTVRSQGQPIVDDWDCFKKLSGTYKKHCGLLSTYGKKHMRAFANMCNIGVQQVEFAKVASQICGNKLN